MALKARDVPVFILAGGLGTRISEESHLRPKPMIEVGDIPVLVHIMRWYYSFGFDKFVICGGYRSWVIKEYFLSYEYRRNHLVVDHRRSADRPPFVINRRRDQEKWEVHVLDTGLQTMTGGRLARAFDETARIMDFDHFAVTYGDGLCNVDLAAQLRFHGEHGKIGTVLGVPPPARFGELNVAADRLVTGFIEKPQDRQGLINGGYFMFDRGFRDYLDGDERCILEHSPLEKLAYDKTLMVYPHHDFWQPMDTLRDKHFLQRLWDEGKAPWGVQPKAAEAAGQDMPPQFVTPPVSAASLV